MIGAQITEKGMRRFKNGRYSPTLAQRLGDFLSLWWHCTFIPWWRIKVGRCQHCGVERGEWVEETGLAGFLCSGCHREITEDAYREAESDRRNML